MRIALFAALLKPGQPQRTRALACMAQYTGLEQVKAQVENGEAQLFDVREPHEFEQAALRLAELVPLSQLQNGVAPPYDTSKLTYLHCAAGVRVHYAAPILEQMGFEKVVPLNEGFSILATSGFEIR